MRAQLLATGLLPAKTYGPLLKTLAKKRNSASYSPARPRPRSTFIENSPTRGTANLQITRTEASAFSGPIPPPDLLAKYAEIIPNGADRILTMAERQSVHRQYIEKWAVIGGTILSYFGVLCALIIALATLYFGAGLIRDGHVISGSIFAGSGLLGVVTAFIYGTRSRKQERQQRDKQNKALTRQK